MSKKRNDKKIYDFFDAETKSKFFRNNWSFFVTKQRNFLKKKKSFLRKSGELRRLNKKRKEGFLTALVATAIKKDPHNVNKKAR